MVQIHAVHAGLPPTRATVDVDMVLHIETGATTFRRAAQALDQLGYSLVVPGDRRAFVHRFERAGAQVDVMVADNLAPRHQPTAAGRRVFAIPAGTSALRKTVNCRIEPDQGPPVTFSLPDPLGALVLKGAAYQADARDRDRHLEDAATPLCGVTDPDADRQRMIGSDRKRLQALHTRLSDSRHGSWLQVPAQRRPAAMDALRILISEPTPRRIRRLGE
ncbi:hypothetical protein [Nocardia sp. NPDC004415]